MAKHRKRLTKKEIKEDQVAEFFLSTILYVRENSKRIAGIAVVVLMAVLVATIAIRQRRAAELEAQAWLARANLDLRDGNIANAIQSYNGVMERYRGTWSHSDALYFSANAHFATGRYDTALVLFGRYLDLKKRRIGFSISSKVGIAQCLEQMRRYSEAAESYLKAQREHPESPLAPDALFGAGRSYELAGDLRSAESAYNDVLNLYPDSRQAAIIKLPLLEVRAKLENT